MNKSLRACANCKSDTGHRYQKFCSDVCRLSYWSEPKGDCWIWKGATHKSSPQHGQLTIEGQTMRLRDYVADIGGVKRSDAESFVPTCGEHLCCNPEHMGVGTKYAPRPRPERKIRRLTAEQVLEIWLNSEALSLHEAAHRYDVTTRTIRDIKSGKTHKALTSRDARKS